MFRVLLFLALVGVSAAHLKCECVSQAYSDSACTAKMGNWSSQAVVAGSCNTEDNGKSSYLVDPSCMMAKAFNNSKCMGTPMMTMYANDKCQSATAGGQTSYYKAICARQTAGAERLVASFLVAAAVLFHFW
eukprot:TRINITY_DN105277_c0_g1_i1.p1 TRINITY_DN105277_c0_g1~~TRINITY_DN105277_c0_g1_i1.p1  ORF type:complete len:132 (+),score=31.55 TRINITY_DN105277_c0_g1_i1:30-425(+)